VKQAAGDPPAPPPLPASVPTTIDIPAIDVHSDVISIGTAPDGTLAVPQPGPDLNKAAWYTNSVTPGQDGPSVIEGHIDSVYGPSVFFELGALRPGNTIGISRTDGSRTVFTVNAVRSYASHAAFPTDDVYGADLAHPTLRLITCSNFDQSTGHYVGNTVVFAHLTSIHHARSAR
jgi:sortase (surface protein transpeptidase)